MSPDSPTAIPTGAHGQDRAALRRELLARRERLEDRDTKDAALGAALLRKLIALRPACLGAYCATRGEFDPLPILAQLARALPGVRFALPVVDARARRMRFVPWMPGDALQAGAYGIDEPAHAAATAEPDTLLVPCVGFVEAGLRLGYGGGYYDRYLAGRSEVYTIGLAYAACELDELRAEPHDQLLDLILTETGAHGLDADAADSQG
ncbi:MAG: 5-formyltetrahydrofolate cyclo-ligase [Thiomonas sp. 15-66-11]|nr:MAG: 5-formyltetrahydrofolate cyclo-ligase [Thiomonas sp. 15-66-11]